MVNHRVTQQGLRRDARCRTAARNEVNGEREIAIWKSGVTL
jgi:hypothetical protein